MIEIVKNQSEARCLSGRRCAASCGMSAVINGCALVVLALTAFNAPVDFDPVTLLVTGSPPQPTQVEPMGFQTPPPILPLVVQQQEPARQQGTIDPTELQAAEPKQTEPIQAAMAVRSTPAAVLASEPIAPAANADRQPWPNDAAAIFSDSSFARSDDEIDGDQVDDWSNFSGSGTGTPGGGKVSFFGIDTKGDAVVFVVDASGSMRGERFKQACAELLYSVENLVESQSFAVFFFNDHRKSAAYPDEQKYVVANVSNKEAFRKWVATIRPLGDTHPTMTIRRALRLKPDLMYFLSDGDIPMNTVRVATADNGGVTIIHTICFQSEDGEERLTKMASENGGEYHYVE